MKTHSGEKFVERSSASNTSSDCGESEDCCEVRTFSDEKDWEDFELLRCFFDGCVCSIVA